MGTTTARDMVASFGLAFESPGAHTLKGMPSATRHDGRKGPIATKVQRSKKSYNSSSAQIERPPASAPHTTIGLEVVVEHRLPAADTAAVLQRKEGPASRGGERGQGLLGCKRTILCTSRVR